MQFLCLPSLLIADRWRGVPVRAALVFLCLFLADGSAAKQPKAVPEFVIIAHAVESYFASVPDYQAGDLISRAHIQGALACVDAAGWSVPNADEMVQLGLADSSTLVRQLSTPAGRKFMRKIAGQPGAYERLDRLTSIARGQAIVSDLIRRKGGDEFVKYLATTKGGQNLGKQLAATRRGVDLNKPTGRIYTKDDLIAALTRVWETRE
ncbi:MAG: hypothetical protein WD738_24160 [Pirellulales bacterium]